MKTHPLDLGNYDYRHTDQSGGLLRLHSYTEDCEYVFVSFPDRHKPEGWVSVSWLDSLTLTAQPQ